jgi:hypothetical protein
MQTSSSAAANNPRCASVGDNGLDALGVKVGRDQSRAPSRAQ